MYVSWSMDVWIIYSCKSNMLFYLKKFVQQWVEQVLRQEGFYKTTTTTRNSQREFEKWVVNIKHPGTILLSKGTDIKYLRWYSNSLILSGRPSRKYITSSNGRYNQFEVCGYHDVFHQPHNVILDSLKLLFLEYFQFREMIFLKRTYHPFSNYP